MSHLEWSIRIKAPPARVREVLEDISETPEWVVSLQRVWGVQGHGEGCQYHWTFKMGGMNLDGLMQITESTPERLVMSTTGTVPSQWVWEMTPKADHTEVKLSIDYNVPGYLFGAIANKLIIERENEFSFRTSLAKLKERLEQPTA